MKPYKILFDEQFVTFYLLIMTKSFLNFYLLLGLGLQMACATQALAKDSQIVVHVGKGQSRLSILAIPYFRLLNSTQANKRFGDNLKFKLYKKIYDNFKTSSYFQLASQDAFLENSLALAPLPKPKSPQGFSFKNWSSIGVHFLLRGDFEIKNSKFLFKMHLYSVSQARALLVNEYSINNESKIDLLANTVSNDIVQHIFKKKSIFLSHIVYSYTNPQRYKEIYIMGWNGSPKKQITFHKNIAISPSWSWNKEKLLYTAFPFHVKSKQRNPDLFIYDLKTKKRKIISYARGVNSGGVFSHKDRSIVLSRTNRVGGSYLVEISVTTGRLIRSFTNSNSRSLYVEPAISPDGRHLAFSSNKTGRPMIYTMNLSTKKIKRLTFAGRYNSSPSWSSDGKYIAFAGYDKGRYDIFTIKKDGTELKRLTTARRVTGGWSNNEDPSFSPDGRMLVFSSDRSGEKHIYIMDKDGLKIKKISKGNGSFERPKWSPY